jgi:hypothetical protein
VKKTEIGKGECWLMGVKIFNVVGVLQEREEDWWDA